MNIYFCDSCGKRFTEETDPVAVDPDVPRKNLCHDCASTTSTIETVPLELKGRMPGAYKAPSTKTEDPIIVMPAATKARKSSARMAAVRATPETVEPAPGDRKPANSNKYIYGGAGVAAVAISLAFFISSKSTKPPAELPAPVAPFSQPVQPVSDPSHKTDMHVAVVERPEIKEERAKTAFDELEIRVDALAKDDPAAKQAVEAFMLEYADTAVGPRARKLLENLSTPKKTGSATSTGTGTSTGIAIAPAATTAEEELKRYLAKLRVFNPAFDGKSAQRIVGGKLVSLTLITTNLTQLGPIHDFTSLDELVLDGKTTSKLAELSPLAGMKITKLTIIHASVENLLPLASLPLTNLDLSFNPVVSLAPLKGMNLKDLTLANTAVTDLAPLQNMPLVNLRIGSTKITDLSPLKGMPLSQLLMMHTIVTDLSPLQGLPLKSLIASDSAVVDLTPLHGVPLNAINFSGTKVADLSPLAGAPLQNVDISKSAVKDLSPLKGAPIAQLAIVSTPVEDLSPLEGMPIVRIQMQGSSVHDLTPLKTLPALVELLIDIKTQEDVDVLRSLSKLKSVNWRPSPKVLDDWKPPPPPKK